MTTAGICDKPVCSGDIDGTTPLAFALPFTDKTVPRDWREFCARHVLLAFDRRLITTRSKRHGAAQRFVVGTI